MSVDIPPTPKRKGDPIKLSPEHKSLDAELYGLGRTLRHLQPPGGKENGVFDAFKLPKTTLPPKKKVKDFFKSHIFDAPVKLSPLPPRPVTPLTESSQYRLFAVVPSPTLKARHNNMKSTVFEPDPPKRAPAALMKRNPITGESCQSIDERNKFKQRQGRNPITFEGINDKHVRSRCTQPPGGKCSLVLEYIE